MRILHIISIVLFFVSCKENRKEKTDVSPSASAYKIEYAKGFSIDKLASGITVLNISSPWPNAKTGYRYALIPRENESSIMLNEEEFDAVVSVPVNDIVATSTTHIPTLEALGVIDKLVGFPDAQYISSKSARKRIDDGLIKELGNNESINTEMVIALNPDVVIGFSINNQNKAYETLERSKIPVVYNGDWTEESPLGKAEWIKFFAPFFQKEQMADSIFKKVAYAYNSAKSLAKKASKKPTVLSGALYKDVWYLPGGKSWAAKFLEDANTNYPWSDSEQTGSLNLSIESVLAKGKDTDFWISPSQFASYGEMRDANVHYLQFAAFKKKNIYTFANTKGETGGLLYYELAPNRPDLVLKDLIHIFHPALLPDHKLFFFKPLN